MDSSVSRARGLSRVVLLPADQNDQTHSSSDDPQRTPENLLRGPPLGELSFPSTEIDCCPVDGRFDGGNLILRGAALVYGRGLHGSEGRFDLIGLFTHKL